MITQTRKAIMDIISRTTIIDLIQSCEGPAITIYLPTYSAGRSKNQSPIRLKNLINQAEIMLSETGMRSTQIRSFLKPIENLINDECFWQTQTEGLAVFLDKTDLYLFRLPAAVSGSRYGVAAPQLHEARAWRDRCRAK